MRLNNYKILLLLLTIIILDGCGRHNPNLDEKEPLIFNDNKKNSWAEETNIDDEDIDISDLNNSLVVDETFIIEDERIKRVPFLISEYKKLNRRGKGTIRGKIYIQDAYNVNILGSQTRLYLNPMTSYSNQWYKESYLGGNKMEKADQNLFNYLKFTASNINGEFAFYGVPSGKYYLIGTVKCSEACGYESEKNIRIASIVEVEGKEIITKDLVRVLD